ncbi:MAG: 2-phospho-L-lactate guanylyltransferase [Mycobacteriales bacterium]
MQAATPYQNPRRRSVTRRRSVVVSLAVIALILPCPASRCRGTCQTPRIMPAVSWGLVVPVKRLVRAKTRLSSYGDAARQDLALAFALDVVAAAYAAGCVEQVLVVTDDPRAAEALSAVGARVVGDLPDAGLNPAIEHGASLLPGGLGVATVSADLPALRSTDIDAALGAVPVGGRGFVVDSAGSGTTLLAAAPGVWLAPAYGIASRSVHLVSGAVELPAAAGLRLDVDTAADLQAALRLGVGAATAAAVRGLALIDSLPPP